MNILERYNDQQHLTLYNKGISGAQENGKFSCKKLLNYLVIPNILLLSLSGAPPLIHPKNTSSYARVKAFRNYRLQRDFQKSLCSCFYVFFASKGTGQYNSITLHTKGTGSVPGPWNPSANSQRYINCPGFPISSNKLDISQSAYMVIAPGTHKLTIDYTIEDPATEIEGTIRKYVNLTCDPGKIYDITANLTPREFYPSTVVL